MISRKKSHSIVNLDDFVKKWLWSQHAFNFFKQINFVQKRKCVGWIDGWFVDLPKIIYSTITWNNHLVVISFQVFCSYYSLPFPTIHLNSYEFHCFQTTWQKCIQRLYIIMSTKFWINKGVPHHKLCFCFRYLHLLFFSSGFHICAYCYTKLTSIAFELD